MILRHVPAVAMAALAACSSPSEPGPEPTGSSNASVAAANQTPPAAAASADAGFDGTAVGTLAPGASDPASPPPDHVGDPPPPLPAVDPAARTIARAEWRKAGNRRTCAPLMLRSDAGAGGKARRAYFGGGWGVAFDQPGRRSAYGFAGTGFTPEDSQNAAAQRARLAAQWPYFRELGQLPRPSFAGYGIEGGKPYNDRNADGSGLNSLAYVRVSGQQCDYNVWSRLGRTHLEHLLENLVPAA